MHATMSCHTFGSIRHSDVARPSVLTTKHSKNTLIPFEEDFTNPLYSYHAALKAGSVGLWSEAASHDVEFCYSKLQHQNKYYNIQYTNCEVQQTREQVGNFVIIKISIVIVMSVKCTCMSCILYTIHI